MNKWLLVSILVLTGCSENVIKRKARVAGKVEPVEKFLDDKTPFDFEAKITWKYGSKPKVLVENLILRRDETGLMQGFRNLSSEDGYEFILFPDGKICVRLRYEKYICRPESENEGRSRAFEILKAPNEFILPFRDNLKISSGEKISSDGFIDSNLKKTSLELAPRKNPVKTADGKFRGKLIYFEGEKVSGSSGLDNSGNMSWGAEFIDESGKIVKVHGKIEFALKKFNGKVSKPDENMVSKNWKRIRPLLDRKKLLGDTVPKQLKHLYR